MLARCNWKFTVLCRGATENSLFCHAVSVPIKIISQYLYRRKKTIFNLNKDVFDVSVCGLECLPLVVEFMLSYCPGHGHAAPHWSTYHKRSYLNHLSTIKPYSLFTLIRHQSPLILNGEWGFLRVNRLWHKVNTIYYHSATRLPHATRGPLYWAVVNPMLAYARWPGDSPPTEVALFDCLIRDFDRSLRCWSSWFYWRWRRWWKSDERPSPVVIIICDFAAYQHQVDKQTRIPIPSGCPDWQVMGFTMKEE